MDKVTYNKLEEEWIINWCWWNKWFNFSRFFRDNISYLDEFDKVKWMKLIEDIELNCCWPHDIDFSNWWWYFNWIIANIKFGYNLYKLLNWTSITNRISISLIVFILLQKYSKNYFNFIK